MGNLKSDNALGPGVGDDIDAPVLGVFGTVAAHEGPPEKEFRFGGNEELKSGEGCAAKVRCECGANWR